MRKIVILLGLVGVIWGAPTPQQVAKRFWEAVRDGNTTLAAAQTVRGEVESALPFSFSVLALTTHDANVTRGRAVVPTTLRVVFPAGSPASSACEITVPTELLAVAGRWRVDGIVTMRAFDRAVADSAAICAKKAFDSMMRKTDRMLEEAMRWMREQNDTLARSMRQWQQDWEKMSKALEREWQKRPQPSGDRLPPPTEGDRI